VAGLGEGRDELLADAEELRFENAKADADVLEKAYPRVAPSSRRSAWRPSGPDV